MTKPKIAFDMDDVLVDSTEFWRREINKKTGSNLQTEHYRVPGPYWQYYEHVWKTHKIDHLISIPDIDRQMREDQSEIQMYAESLEVLQRLSEKYELVIITARNSAQKVETHKWIKRNFPGMFSEIEFAEYADGASKKNKGQICKEIGAEWMVDDNPDHCRDALNEGVKAVLFGEYGWHQDIPDQAVRCKDWLAVGEYFNERP